ncbi:putative minichromosome loss protein, Mcl1, middle region [Lyophyllum shimeji]|uniref:Minichromosome loss protein, Mcl1, middle region n=1 Tax=Lyophyllum shimeji TaxID=47721 RepID=A0A9P3PXX4_LYOSH|nr:putative minichromosome loss protein, Mcl1, middle region [Lyophyllum shimeji]
MSKLIASPAHESGITCLTFSRDGSHAYTGGQDCIIRIWKINEGPEQEPMTASEADQAITAVAASENCWLSGSEDAVVRQYIKERAELNGHVLDANGVAIRSLAIDPTGKRVAIASDNFDVKVVQLEDITIFSQLKGHVGSVRRVSWHPTSSLLALMAKSLSGTCRLSNQKSKPQSRVSFRQLEIPRHQNTLMTVRQYGTLRDNISTWLRGLMIATISRSDWTKSSTFSDKDVSGPITALAISVNGVYLASASQAKVHIWSTQTRRVVASQAGTPGAIITHLAFSPSENLLAWTDSEGGFNRWPKAVPDHFPDPVKRSIATTAPATIPARPKTTLFDDIAEATSTTGRETLDDDVDLDAGFGDVDDDWIIDDLGGGLRDEAETAERKKDGFVKEMVSITKAQPPFQPGSTPMENRKRYLAYNLLGVIEVTDQDTHHIINVEFFDRSARKGYHFTDHFKYHLGYLGERGAVFACPPENSHPAQVLYKPYGTWTNQGEWTYVLKRPGTSVLGVAAGGLKPSSSLRLNSDQDLQGYGNVVVATSEGDLTFLSGTGRERRILGLGGDYVTMVASAEWVFVVHRAGSTTIDGSQNLSYSIINFEDFSVKQRDVLPIPKGHILKWVGLTDQGAPAIYDSAGWVHVLTKFRIPHHASWARVMDTNLLERRQGKDESYWPVGITESNFMCLILKGRQEHPGFPRPLIQELPMRFPFRRDEPKEELIERELLHIHTALDSLDEELTTDAILARERAMDKEFIQLIQAACKADNIPRALELTKLLHHTTSFAHAMQIAAFYHLVGLREKMAVLRADREEQEDRLVALRNKRRRWLKPDPPVREVQAAANSSSSARVDLLGDVRPPPAIERPRLARVTTPVLETTQYSAAAAMALQPQDPPSFIDEVPSPSAAAAASSSYGEGKRKRADLDDLESSFPTPPPPRQKVNPFARKAGQQEPRNPFARKAEANANGNGNGKTMIQKSESFFDKVGAAGAGQKKEKGKEKEKEREKGASRQTTLFGLPPPKAKDKEKEKKEKDRKTKKGATAGAGETQDSQATDVTMAELEGETQVETQEDCALTGEDDTAGADAGSSWEETQLGTSHSQDVETQLVESQ